MSHHPENLRLRPVRESDLPALLRLLDSLTDSLTTLPRNQRFLESRIHKSIRAFYPNVDEPGSEEYLFVLADDLQGQLYGCSGIVARVGGFKPFFTYQIIPERVEHKPQGICHTIDVLHLRANHDGPSEIGSLFLHPDLRGGGIGRLLSLARFLFMAAYPSRFQQRVIAEMRGYIGPDGKSPFWETVGRHFFLNDFHQADFLSGLGQKDFIRDLMPRHPIYLPLLPEQTRRIIGEVHPHTVPARRLLLREGFAVSDEVDIFDAGPQLAAELPQIRCVRQSREVRLLSTDVAGIPPAAASSPAEVWLLSNGRLDFRACLGAYYECEPDGIVLNPATAELLEVGIGDSLRLSPLH